MISPGLIGLYWAAGAFAAAALWSTTATVVKASGRAAALAALRAAADQAEKATPQSAVRA